MNRRQLARIVVPRANRITVALLTLAALFNLPTRAGAQVAYDVVAGFDASGIGPSRGMIQASDGNFYGTTTGGGSFGFGTVFKMDAAGIVTTLHSFAGADGYSPDAGLMQASDGAFYGTTSGGGPDFANSPSNSPTPLRPGSGTIFRIDASGTLTTLHYFTGADGAAPSARLVQGNDGVLYGTTQVGGAGNAGTIFTLDAAGLLTTRYTFTRVDGAAPNGLVFGGDGTLYGTTLSGGVTQGRNIANGTIFKVDATWTLTTLHTFYANVSDSSSADGNPDGNLIRGADGSFYGTTTYSFVGTFFKIDAAGTFTVLHTFNNAEGTVPVGGVVQGPDGSFYGTTAFAGPPDFSFGAIYKIDGSGIVTVLHYFDRSDNPTNSFAGVSGLILGRDGYFYGATAQGGAFPAPSYPRGTVSPGTTFKFDASSGTFTTLHSFRALGSPRAGVVESTDGRLYGTTAVQQRGLYGGSVFAVDPAAAASTTLFNFTATGADAGLIRGSDGLLYGTTCGTDVTVTTGPDSPPGPQATVFNVDAAGLVTTLRTWYVTLCPVAGLVQAVDGNLYGTTSSSIFRINAAGAMTTLQTFSGSIALSGLMQAADGAFYGTINEDGRFGLGEVFKITAAGTLTYLHYFTDAEGWSPVGRLVQASDGRIYGTTRLGGASGQGTVYSIDPAGALTIVHEFSGADGASPFGGLVQASDASLYGTTALGGASGSGTIFRIDSAGNFTSLRSFTHESGANPAGELIEASDGSLYGTTQSGGPQDGGVVFRVRAESANHPPSAAGDTYTADTNGVLIVAAPGILANDSDPDGNTLTAVLSTSVSHGNLVLNRNGSLTYTPATGYLGPDSFTYQASDGSAASSQATVSIVVAARLIPTVTSVSPTAGATAVPLAALITATFSRPMLASTLTTTTVSLVAQGTTMPVAATVAYAASSSTVSLTPTADLAASTEYTATIKGGGAGAKDVDGTALVADTVWSFTTAAAAGGSSYLSDRTWTTAINGWGPIEKDRSNGETGADDGAAIILNGVSYAKGLGVHAPSDVRYVLGGSCTVMTAVVGVDDEVGANGSIVFQVWTDGIKKYDSGLMTGDSATRSVSVDVSGASELTLIVSDGGDGAEYDHGDWANAQVSCSAAARAR